MIKLIKSTFFHELQTKKALCAFILKSEQLSIGKKCDEFEKRFAIWQKRKFCVLFNTGSSANLALIQALLNLGVIGKGSKIGFSGITWATNVMPLMQLGLEPIPIDVEVESLNVSPKTLEDSYNKNPFQCLFLTNLLGLSDDILGIKNFCQEKNILLLEDNCESLGSISNNIMLGNFGLASTFSFFVGHHMSAIEGGAVCTNDKDLNRELRMVRSHGWDRHLSKKEQKFLRLKHNISDFEAKYTFFDLAYNLRPTEITGFLGLHQLAFLHKTIKSRESNFNAFLTLLKNSAKFYPLNIKMNCTSNFAMPIICKAEVTKKKCIQLCKKKGIEIRPIVGGVMSDQPFFKKYITKTFYLPNSRLIHKNGFYFANNPELSQKEIKYIISTLSSI
ncbi:MAG: DegT/DnrJ/EryC1/StrS family aminotransferase [Candidatus Pacebacteria bacterium]|nr:DegT/DnrJ/EryC1/StrS family aminotransferase [Candidatus Paceibacterota bacterium]